MPSDPVVLYNLAGGKKLDPVSSYSDYLTKSTVVFSNNSSKPQLEYTLKQSELPKVIQTSELMDNLEITLGETKDTLKLYLYSIKKGSGDISKYFTIQDSSFTIT